MPVSGLSNKIGLFEEKWQQYKKPKLQELQEFKMVPTVSTRKWDL